MSKDSTGSEIFKEKIHIIETPNRGGTGLNKALRNIANFAVKVAKGEQ